MNLGVVGARNFDNRAFVDAAIRRVARKEPDAVLLVSAFSWVGTWARIEATRHRLAVVEYPAEEGDWRAAHRRLVADCDALVVFWDGQCRVTAEAVILAQRGRKVLRIYRFLPRAPR